MAIRFNADEILTVAETIEQNGARFYEKATECVTAGRSRALLQDLAQREKAHQRIFSTMRAELRDNERESVTFDPDAESALYLQALASSAVFKPDQDPMTRLGPQPAYRDILTTAIQMEKDSIVFYTGMKEFVSEQSGRGRVEGVLKEEMRHLTALSQELTEQA
jgi:rubrerythrin